ncbi:MAG: alpha-galactosidase, partial [Verrucomicrobiota bacterium]
VTLHREHPAVEWVLRFRNTADRETPILADVQALDTTLEDRRGDFLLHHARRVGEGIEARHDDLGPVSRPLVPGSVLGFHSLHGRPSWGESLPFFNLELPGDRGVIAGLGWTGQWQASFATAAGSVRLRAGMERLRLKLYPGEEIRSPRILLLFWQGHRYYGQNLLRRLILAHHHPQRDGRPATLPFAASMDAWTATEKNQLAYAARMEKLGIEYLWLDAGWWKDPGDRSKGLPSHIGPVGRERFPRGFRPVTDALRRKGMGLVVWFAPEYQGGGSWMDKAFPELFLRLKKGGPADFFTLMNFGDRNALRLLTDATASLIATEGIGVYRQDGPMGANCPLPERQPLAWWREADPPDREGLTEIRHVEGLYSFWDEIVRRHPGLLIDLCGGGATRIDLEAMSRGVYAWRSDWNHPGFEPEAEQSRTYGASLWLPSTGTASGYPETYSFRSSINNGVALCWNPDQPPISPLAAPVRQKPPHQILQTTRTTVDQVVRAAYQVTEPFPWDSAVRLAREFRRVRGLFQGDFYPLTPYSIADDVWLAYQFHRDDWRRGMILAFRRTRCLAGQVRLRLWGLGAKRSYQLKFEDTGVTRSFTGRELAAGLDVAIGEQPGAALITYRELP